MAENEISVIHRQMIDAVGHRVEIRIVGGYRLCVGKCINYTQPLDNDPEVASIDIQVPGYSSITELTEDEIESITIKD